LFGGASSAKLSRACDLRQHEAPGGDTSPRYRIHVRFRLAAAAVALVSTWLAGSAGGMHAGPAAAAGWRLDPPVLEGNVGIYRCTPRWARTDLGSQALCNGRRMVFRTQTVGPPTTVAITGFKLFGDRRHGIVDYRIHVDWNYDVDVGYTTDRIRFQTGDGGRHWAPKSLRRQDMNQTKPPGGIGTRPPVDEYLPVKPCVWRNYARPSPHRASKSVYGNTCIPLRTARRFPL
jgi:hypothetical protein